MRELPIVQRVQFLTVLNQRSDGDGYRERRFIPPLKMGVSAPGVL